MGIRNRNTQRIILTLMFLFSIPYIAKAENDLMFNYQKSNKNVHYAIRLKPNQDLRQELENFAKHHNIKSGYIITTVGSLKKACIRFANQSDTTIIEDKLEIVSLVGIISVNGSHLHISLSDKTGKTIGGHLQKGSEVFTTAEIIIGNLEDLEFKREEDKETTYKELKIIKTD